MIYNPLSPPPAPPPASGANYSAEHGCFEGPEKLLEIWFSPSPVIATSTPNLISDSSLDASDSDLSDISTPTTPNCDTFCDKNLRTVEKPVWDAMLATVKCTVLNVIHNSHVDAYLLRYVANTLTHTQERGINRQCSTLVNHQCLFTRTR
jgi:S-adenosylmethionine decarboxylase